MRMKGSRSFSCPTPIAIEDWAAFNAVALPVTETGEATHAARPNTSPVVKRKRRSRAATSGFSGELVSR
jgi:hypothetical protein